MKSAGENKLQGMMELFIEIIVNNDRNKDSGSR